MKRWKQRGVPTEVGGDPGYAVSNARVTELSHVRWKAETTIAALFQQSRQKHSKNIFLGSKKLISKEFVIATDGRKFEKLNLGECEWQAYGEVFDRACNFSSGLVRFSHDVDTRVAVYTATRAEQFTAFQVILFVVVQYFFSTALPLVLTFRALIPCYIFRTIPNYS